MAAYVDLLSDLHIGCRIKFKYQNAHNSKHQIALDLKFSINAGNLIKYRKRGDKGSLYAMSVGASYLILVSFALSSYPQLYNIL